MTQPQAQEPGAQQMQLDPRHLLRARKQRIESLTEENDMLVALNGQILEKMRDLEEELEQLKSSKESDGAEPPAAEGTPNPSQAGHDEPGRRNGGRRGPSPADVARRARTQG